MHADAANENSCTKHSVSGNSHARSLNIQEMPSLMIKVLDPVELGGFRSGDHAPRFSRRCRTSRGTTPAARSIDVSAATARRGRAELNAIGSLGSSSLRSGKSWSNRRPPHLLRLPSPRSRVAKADGCRNGDAGVMEASIHHARPVPSISAARPPDGPAAPRRCPGRDTRTPAGK